MKIDDAQALLNAKEKERKENYNNNAQYILQTLVDILDNENILVTSEFERGDLRIELTNKNYRGLYLFRPKVFVTVSWDNIEEKNCYYRYVPFCVESFSPKCNEALAKFIVYLYKKLKL